ncbi:MAG: hypothetical protein DHS20C20_12060 [Ardenticatenaceae bacterium]|nr:MAG: hypothetical protein DHS20C20_12060 [Ardenticatenaceae bacterium]
MSRLLNIFFVPLFFIFAGALLVFSSSACSENSPDYLVQAAEIVTNEVDDALADPNDLVFAGQVEDENGRWLNNCVVILFKHGEEVARSTTSLRETAFSSDGPMDGVFELRISNEYKFSENHEFFYYPSGAAVDMRIIPGVVGNRYLGTWEENLNPSDFLRFHVPSKQAEYALVVLPMPLDEMPESHRSGNLTFQDGMLVIKPEEASEDEPIVEEETAVPLPLPETNVQFTFLPREGQAWNLQLTGYYGNRWDVWEKYVAGRGIGMSWETFKVAVLSHNPQLEEDGFVFYPDKYYLLPTSP